MRLFISTYSTIHRFLLVKYCELTFCFLDLLELYKISAFIQYGLLNVINETSMYVLNINSDFIFLQIKGQYIQREHRKTLSFSSYKSFVKLKQTSCQTVTIVGSVDISWYIYPTGILLITIFHFL